MEKLKLISNVKLDYVTEWEKARYEQNLLRCDMEIEKLEKMLKDRRVREKNERRVHAELTKFLTQEIAVSIELIVVFLFNCHKQILRTFIQTCFSHYTCVFHIKYKNKHLYCIFFFF